MIRGRGGFLGPDLTDIGALRTVTQLRESLLKPGARIVDGYEGVSVIMQDGSKISGVARNANNYSMQILQKNGALRLLAMDDVREVEFRKSSLMPEDFGKRLPAADIANVLAFLSRQSVRPPGQRGADERSRGEPKMRWRATLATLILIAPLGAQVRYEDILRSPGNDWLTYAGDYQGKRHSPLTQITRDNAASLVPKWVYRVEGGHASGIDAAGFEWRDVRHQQQRGARARCAHRPAHLAISRRQGRQPASESRSGAARRPRLLRH